jgi:hypothetical protein
LRLGHGLTLEERRVVELALVDGDWLEAWLRQEIERRRAELPSVAKSEVGIEVGTV